MIVVTGATGNIGRAFVEELVHRSQDVRAVVRDPAKADLPDAVEVVAGDLAHPESLGDAFAGADGALLLPGYPGLARAAHDAGVGRAVQISGGSAGSNDLTNAVTAYMRASEAELLDTGLAWTIVRPVAFQSNALRWLSQLDDGDEVALPFADVPIACIHPRDIAEVAVVALTEDGHERMVYRPTGPEALTPEQQVAIVAAATGRALRFRAQSNAEARRDMLASTPPEYVAAFFDFYVNGSLDETTVRPTVADVTGHPPRPLREWAGENADRFRRGSD